MAELEQKTGSRVRLFNASRAGADTDWAIAHAAERLPLAAEDGKNPDLVILAWGMNDRCPGPEYREKTARLIETVRGLFPDTEVLFVATTLPHPLAATPPIYFCAHQSEYAEALSGLTGPGVGLADVQSVQKELMKRKRYADISGNWLNHPNDYLVRVQAQTIAAALLPE